MFFYKFVLRWSNYKPSILVYTEYTIEDILKSVALNMK